MGWSVVEKGKAAPSPARTATSSGSGTASGTSRATPAASTPPAVKSEAVYPGKTGAVPDPFELPLATKLEGIPENSRQKRCIAQGLNLEGAQAFLESYSRSTVPMACLKRKPIPGAASVHYQLLVYDRGVRVSSSMRLTQAPTVVTTPKHTGLQVALLAISFAVKVLDMQTALSELAWRAYVAQPVDVEPRKTGKDIVELGAVRGWCARKGIERWFIDS